MTRRKARKPHSHYGVAAALAGVCTAFGVDSARAETSVAPRIGADLTWVDNIGLAADGSSQEDQLVLQARPGIRIVHDTQRTEAFLDYQLQAIHFNDSSDSDEVFHQGQLGLQAALVPDWFYVDLGGAHHQTVVDPTKPVNQGNIFQVGNLADSTEAHLTPILLHRFRIAEIEASYTEGLVNYSNAGDQSTDVGTLDDSKNSHASFALRSADPDPAVSWETSYRRDKVNYDLAETFDYEQANAEVGVRVGSALRLLARGGRETDPREGISDGGLDASSWQGGFAWSRGLNSELRVLYGHRFFGKSFDALWRYSGRVLEYDISYFESPTTQAQDRVLRSTTAPPPGAPPDTGGDFARATSDVYLLKRLEGQIGLRGRLTEIHLSLHSERREYFPLTGREDKSHNARLFGMRRLGPQMRFEFVAGITDATLREGDDYKEYTYSVSLLRQLGKRTDLVLSGNRFERTGGFTPYKANWVALSIAMRFGDAGKQDRAEGQGVIRRRPTGPARPDMPTVPGYQ